MGKGAFPGPENTDSQDLAKEAPRHSVGSPAKAPSSL